MNINDRELLARTLQAEAGNQGFGGMMAAGSVIMNRANATGYGNGLRGVILKPGQFSAWNSRLGPNGKPIYAGGAQGQDMANMRASDNAYKAADALITGGYEDKTGGATHYYNPGFSNPDWGRDKAGGDWKQIGDHIFGFADAVREPNPNRAIADDTMRVLGKQPKGILAPTQTSETETKPMMQQQKPRGLLENIGIQKMQEGAEGETGQRFYNRDSFKDTAATLAQGFGRMGIMGMEEIADQVANQRTESKARNKTIEYLRKANRNDLADAVESGSLGARDAAGIMFAQPNDSRTALMQNYEYAMSKGMSPEDARAWVSSGGTTNINMPGEKGANKFAELDAAALVDVSKSAMAAGRSLGQIDRLESLLSNVGTGAAASLQSLAGSFGIKTEGLGDIQAAEALISALVPQQRAPGSGPMSDADLDLFKLSLPRLINTPGGNAMILQTMRGLAQYDALGGEIVQKYRSKDITNAEAFDQLQARPDPFAQFRQVVGAPEGNAGISRAEATELLLGNGGKD